MIKLSLTGIIKKLDNREVYMQTATISSELALAMNCIEKIINECDPEKVLEIIRNHKINKNIDEDLLSLLNS